MVFCIRYKYHDLYAQNSILVYKSNLYVLIVTERMLVPCILFINEYRAPTITFQFDRSKKVFAKDDFKPEPILWNRIPTEMKWEN